MGKFHLRICGAKIRSRQGFILPAGAVAVSRPLSGGRAAGTEQQPSREKHKALRHWTEEFPLRQHAPGRQGQRRNLQPH